MIEVMIVVVLLAITAAVALPMVGNRSDMKLAAAVRTLVGDLQYAQNYAIATRQNIYVRFDANQYTLCTRNNAGTLTAITHPIDRGDFTVSFNSSTGPRALAGVTLAKPNWSSAAAVGFDAVGGPFTFTETTAEKIVLNSRVAAEMKCGTLTRSVYVEPYTGEVTTD